MLDARVTRITIQSTTPVANTGPVGPYEQLRGQAEGEIDPLDRRNAVITDILLAPRNANGKVTYTTQFSLLAKLAKLGPMTVNALARELVMDRTTLGRTMLPLERDGLISIKDGTSDRRSKELAVTKKGTVRLQRAAKLWTDAQKTFEGRFGVGRAADLRNILHAVVHCELDNAMTTTTDAPVLTSTVPGAAGVRTFDSVNPADLSDVVTPHRPG